jgi:FtsP/CotA-like multicopper oxidase with cupredoxin domain
MSNAQRLAVLVGALIVLVGGFILLSPGSSDKNDTVTTPAATTTTKGTATATTAAPEPAATTIRVAGGKPVGGVQSITAHKGDTVRIKVTSPDTTSEVHLHGYDIKRELKAGGSVSFSFKATAEGIFEMELEGTATQIAKIAIEP